MWWQNKLKPKLKLCSGVIHDIVYTCILENSPDRSLHAASILRSLTTLVSVNVNVVYHLVKKGLDTQLLQWKRLANTLLLRNETGEAC